MTVRPGSIAVGGLVLGCRPGCRAEVVTTGARLDGATATVKVCVMVSTPPLAVPPLSFTVTVIVAVAARRRPPACR